jgi:hypothetical protein
MAITYIDPSGPAFAQGCSQWIFRFELRPFTKSEIRARRIARRRRRRATARRNRKERRLAKYWLFMLRDTIGATRATFPKGSRIVMDHGAISRLPLACYVKPRGTP